MEMKELVQQIAVLTERVAKLEAQSARDRGPKSETEMSEAIAFAVKFGEDKDLSHKAAATKHKVSYGQIFSCRGGYTFKHVKADWKPPVAAPEAKKEEAKQ